MTYKMDSLICEINYTQRANFPKLLNTDCLPLIFNLNQEDGQLLLELHLLILVDIISHALQPTQNAVRIYDTPGGISSLSVG